MTLIGIDSSTTKTGMSIFREGRFISVKLIDLRKMKNAEERIDEMIRRILWNLELIDPDVVYQEYSWVKRNPKTAIQLTLIIGAVRGWCVNNGVQFRTVMPAEWRKLTSQNGGERDDLKQQTKDFVKEKFNIETKTDDEADAICIGLAGCLMEDKNESK